MSEVGAFVPRVSCVHLWEQDISAPHRERCGECDAICTRDKGGQIVEYSARAPGLEPRN